MTRAVHGFSFVFRKKTAKEAPLSVVMQWCIGLLVALLLSSAFSVVYLKDLSRRLFIHYQTLQHVQQSDEVKQTKLLLEEGAWSTQSRIQTIATHQLGMKMPSMKNVVIIRD